MFATICFKLPAHAEKTTKLQKHWLIQTTQNSFQNSFLEVWRISAPVPQNCNSFSSHKWLGGAAS